MSPSLPKLGVATKVTATVTTKGKIGGCTGGPVKGVTGAAVATVYKYTGNCTTLVTGKGGKTVNGASTLTWTNHKTSTIDDHHRSDQQGRRDADDPEADHQDHEGSVRRAQRRSAPSSETAPTGTCQTTGASKATLTGFGPASTFK